MESLKYLQLLSRYKLLKWACVLLQCDFCCVVKAVGPGASTFCSGHVKNRTSFLGFACMWKEAKMGSPLVKQLTKLNFGGIPAVQKQSRLARDLRIKMSQFCEQMARGECVHWDSAAAHRRCVLIITVLHQLLLLLCP